MLQQAIQETRSRIDVFADFANNYLRLRMEYATMQEPKLSLGESKETENKQKLVSFLVKRLKKKEELQACANDLTNSFNDAIVAFCEGMRDDQLTNYTNEIISDLSVIFVRFNRLANIDVFKGILYIKEENKPLLSEISNKIATYTDKEQLVQLKEQIDALLRLEREENIFKGNE